MKKEINAVGIACPQPVILTKKEFDQMDKGIVEILADNKTCVENLEKFANSQGYTFKYEEKAEDRFLVTIEKTESSKSQENKEVVKSNNDLVIAFSSNKMGKGDDALGEILIKSFIYTVKETSPLPKALVFFNSGVFLTTSEGQILDDLKDMASKGVKIISCGTCLDFYKRKEMLGVGEISNMYEIYETIKNAGNNITIG